MTLRGLVASGLVAAATVAPALADGAKAPLLVSARGGAVLPRDIGAAAGVGRLRHTVAARAGQLRAARRQSNARNRSDPVAPASVDVGHDPLLVSTRLRTAFRPAHAANSLNYR